MWSKLSPEVQQQPNRAKKDACQVFFDSDAWQPIQKNECEGHFYPPMCFSLKWKYDEENTRKASAMVIWRGVVRHDCTTSRVLDEEPYLVAVGAPLRDLHRGEHEVEVVRRRCFLQGDEVREAMTNSGTPTPDVRRICGLQEG